MLYQKYRQVKEKNNQLFDKVQKLLTETEEKKALMAQPVNIPSEQQDDKPKYQRNYICEIERFACCCRSGFDRFLITKAGHTDRRTSQLRLASDQ